MGLKSDFALLHAAEKLVAAHKGAVAELEPILSIARTWVQDGDGALSREEVSSALKTELTLLSSRHATLHALVDDVHAVLPDASEEG